MFIYGSQTGPIMLSYNNNCHNTHMGVFEPSNQILTIDFSHQYEVIVPWTIILFKYWHQKSYRKTLITVCSVNFAKENPLENNQIYKPFLYNTFSSLTTANNSIVTGICGTSYNFEGMLNFSLNELAAAAYSLLWNSRFVNNGDYEYHNHPMFQKYFAATNVNLLKEEPARYYNSPVDENGIKLFEAWENMSYEELCSYDWGESMSFQDFRKSLNIKGKIC